MIHRKFLYLIMVLVTGCASYEFDRKKDPVAFNCSLSEFNCKTGRCISMDRVCNGVDECGDKSDEIPHCSPCNRTYFGDVGRTYELEIKRPREDGLPFLCFLNFTAAGGSHGNIVQITFDKFTVGKFVSYFVDGCPDGFMSIREENLPNTEGKWCGSAWGYSVYYSESSSLNLTLFLSRLTEQGMGYIFDFKILFKFLRKTDAIVRYGNSTISTYRGNLIAGTYCDRILEYCDTRQCRIQSPNYPGIYPRNVTCYYRVEVRGEGRRRQRPLIVIGQRSAQKIHTKDQLSTKYERVHHQILRTWDQCNVIQDYLTIYDGPSTEDPILVRMCGGGPVPDIIGSNAHILLEFRTSPYDNPFYPVLSTSLPGFELDVKILHTTVGSSTLVPRNQKCNFLIASVKAAKSWGYIKTPAHSLPPNTTCEYHFQGRSDQNVWISFLSYHTSSWDQNVYHLEMECNAKLSILDGPTILSNGKSMNATIMGEFCGDQTPKICDHAILKNRSHFTRPCTLEESYVSSSSDLTLKVLLLRGSVLYPLNFELRYEFVETSSSENSPAPVISNGCNHVFESTVLSNTRGGFRSPRRIFYYGRGGSSNLTCVFRFHASSHQKIHLQITSAKFGHRHCRTEVDPDTKRSRCVYNQTSGPKAEIFISEYVWPNVAIPRGCLCSQLEGSFQISSLVATILEVNFTVTNMNVSEDHENIFFDGEYHFMNELSPADSELCLEYRLRNRIRGAGGEISNKNLKVENPLTVHGNNVTMLPMSRKCGNYPWLIEASNEPMKYLFLRTRGYELTGTNMTCSTSHRVLVYTVSDPRTWKIICPLPVILIAQSENSLSWAMLFSNGWNGTTYDTVNFSSFPRSFVIEFLDSENTATSLIYPVSWLEVTKSFDSKCPNRCPELKACINSTLFCDNVQHCPSGYDESDISCKQLSAPIIYVMVGGGLLLVLTMLILCTTWCKYRQFRKEAHLAEKQSVRSNLRINNIATGHTCSRDIYCKRYSMNSTDFALCKDREDT